jgi:hypothetical protein
MCCAAQSPIVQDFWRVLESFSDAERASFLQFAWARSRLPDDASDATKPLDQKSYRMQLAIEDVLGPGGQAALDQRLPHSETCFFNLALPKYSSPEIMRAKLLTAMQTTSSTFPPPFVTSLALLWCVADSSVVLCGVQSLINRLSGNNHVRTLTRTFSFSYKFFSLTKF